MKNALKSIMICAFSVYTFFPTVANAQESEEEIVTVDGTAYHTSMPYRWFSNYTDFGEKLDFGTVNDRNEAGFFRLGLDINENLSEDDQEKWDNEFCENYIYPECLNILKKYNENSTINFVLGLLYFSGVPNRNISKNENFLDRDLEKSRGLVGRAADLGLPEALNFRALMTIGEWVMANPDADVFKIPPSVEQDLKAAVIKNYSAAKLNLAGLYMERKNYAEARAIYENLSAGRLADANYALGVIYLAGYGVPSNYVKAREYFSKAAPDFYKSVRGNEVSYNLGMMHFRGHGGPVDYKLARQWVEKAAKEKFAPAVVALPRIDRAQKNEANAAAALKALGPATAAATANNQQSEPGAEAGLSSKVPPQEDDLLNRILKQAALIQAKSVELAQELEEAGVEIESRPSNEAPNKTLCVQAQGYGEYVVRKVWHNGIKWQVTYSNIRSPQSTSTMSTHPSMTRFSAGQSGINFYWYQC
jgi:TPR repeat protein